MPINPDHIWIEPTTEDALVCAKVGMNVGNLRGFFSDDDAMVLFSGYGMTHTTVARFLNVRGGMDFVVDCHTGRIHCLFALARGGLDNNFAPHHALFFRHLHECMGFRGDPTVGYME